MRKATRRYIWDRMKVSLWFVPLVMAFGAFCLSWLLGLVDERVPNQLLTDSKLVLAGSATEMRAAMLGIAGTILATTGVVFSLLTLPLSTVASQYGSRLLRIFLRDRTTQIVLGIFVGTFCYCLATALAIPPNDALGELPQISVTFGFLFALAAFASLILLIQHISTMLQAPNIAAAAGAELIEAVNWEISSDDGETQNLPEPRRPNPLVESEAFPLRVNETGYIQFVDPEIIVNLASDKDLMVRLLCRPGQFVSPNETVALIWPSARVEARLGEHLRRAIQIGTQRAPTQDIEYAINQLVEVAMRAMSPAINDPFTAMTCMDYLAEGLASYVGSGEISSNFYDHKGKLRLNFEPTNQVDLLGAAFDQLRHASRDNATVLLHLLDAIDIIGQAACSSDVRRELIRHIHLVQMEGWGSALVEPDQQELDLHCEMVRMKLETAGR
jgi:uncharacterized membrane protein